MKKRFLAFWVCMAVLLASFTGCYSAQKDGPSMPSSSQTVQSGSGSGAEEPVEIKTYPLPEENVQADRIYAPSPSTGGFWTFAVFNASSIQAYDPVTRTSYIPCYQAGCKHNDESCTAYFGKEITALAEYRGNFYAMICYNDDTASALVTRPVSGGPLEVLARWEPENENEVRRCGLYGLSFGKAYLTVAKETFAMEDGQMETADEEYSKCSIELETGEIDVMKVEPTQMESIEGNDQFTVKEVQTLKTAVFAINTTVEPLDNKLVRQALNYACDKQTIIDVAYEGYAAPARLQASDANCFGVDFSGAEEVTYDPEKAKELLAEAGYPDGLNLSDYGVVLDVMGGTYLEKAAQIYQQNLADIGVTLELRNTSTPDEDAESGNFSMMTQTLSYRADFSYNVCQYGTSGIGGNNFSQLSDPYIDEMFAKAESEADEATRQELYKELIAYIIDLAPSVPIFHHELIYAWNNRLEGVVHDSTVHPYYFYEWNFAE